MTDEISISVVCPAYNSGRYITATLESVFRQTVPPEQLIVSDDGSTDDTVAVVERLFRQYDGIRGRVVLKNAHRGPGAGRNAGIRAARSIWVAFLDSDDIWLPTKIEKVRDVIAAHPEKNFFCHSEEHIGPGGVRRVRDYGKKFRPYQDLTRQLYLSNLFSTSAVVCRRSLLSNYGLFDEDLSSAQDYELWLRLSRYLRPGFISDVLGYYVERRGNITSGSLSRRMMNEVRIANRHGAQVPAGYRVLRLGRIVLSYFRQGVRRLIPGFLV